ncbi:hypothetical protein WK28_15935 [Burkholderia vietnamiensis]|nr:hypothetical protein WK28_15935 [Burkholderia vietnamiensis]
MRERVSPFRPRLIGRGRASFQLLDGFEDGCCAAILGIEPERFVDEPEVGAGRMEHARHAREFGILDRCCCGLRRRKSNPMLAIVL